MPAIPRAIAFRLLAVLLVFPQQALPQQGVLAGFHQQPFLFPADTQTLWLADLNGDGLEDLILERENSLQLHFQQSPQAAERFDFDSDSASLDFETGSAGWDLMPRASGDGFDIVTLRPQAGGLTIYRWPAQQDELLSPEQLLANAPGFLSRGVTRLRVAQDINDDGHADLVVPGAGELGLYLADSAGAYASAFKVNADFRMRTSLNPTRLDRGQGQRLRIPAIELRDVNNDGAADLVSETELALEVFLAEPGQESYFPVEPSYRLDIAEIEERLGEFDIDNLDFSNLTGVLALTHEELLEDVNNDGIDDLVLREGPRVALYLGSETGMDLQQPAQILRSSGNVLSTFLHDENEDGLKDLWLWRVEPISVGDIFVWLAISGSIAVEAFIYPNDGEQFSRRPSRKVTVNLRFPSFISLSSRYRDLSNSAESAEPRPPFTAAQLDDSDSALDAIVLMNNELRLFKNRIEAEDEDSGFLAGLGYSRDRDDYEIDIRQILAEADVESDPLWQSIDGREPDDRISLDPAPGVSDVLTVRLNADGRDDLIVFTGQDASHIRGMLLLSIE